MARTPQRWRPDVQAASPLSCDATFTTPKEIVAGADEISAIDGAILSINREEGQGS